MHPMDYEQEIYQCEDCGRLYFDDPENPCRFISFAPEDKSVMVTGPVEGNKWKGYIYGFSDLGMELSVGSCFTSWNKGSSCEERYFNTYEEMRTYFDAKVEELKSQNLLSRAWVNKDGETVFSWDLEGDLPVQKKLELYLTDEEALAIAEFESAHKDCRNLPRGPKGWYYSYEVLPGICGADDRGLKVTCLRCGGSLESNDGRLLLREGSSEVSASDFENAILDLIHTRGSRDVRCETISLPARHHEIAEAVGYIHGLVDAARILNPDTPVADIAHRTFSKLIDDESILASPELRNLVRSACSDGCFDWAIEEGLSCLKNVLKDQYPNITPGWLDEPKKKRG